MEQATNNKPQGTDDSLEEVKSQPASDLPGNPEELKQKCQEYLNNWKRERADFLNYKKNEMEKAALVARYAKEDVLLKILPVLDNIYLAEKQIPENLKHDAWFGGFTQIRSQIADFLKKEGIVEIKTVGEKFNAETMDVIEETDAGESGTVSEEVQKGYIMEDMIIRPAKVKVNK